MVKRGGIRRVSGFTIIEVMLTLSISGMVLVGALLGVSSTLSRQRYRDTVESTASLLRRQYDYVSRIQIDQRSASDSDLCTAIINSATGTVSDSGTARGRSNCSIYGVALMIGLDDGKRIQATNLVGLDYSTIRNESDIDTISETELLKRLKLTNLVTDGAVCRATSVLTNENLKWDAKLETTKKDQYAKYIIAIVRSPRSGSIHTYVANFSGKDEYKLYDYAKVSNSDCNGVDELTFGAVLNGETGSYKFTSNEDVNLCVHSDDAMATNGRRRMIQITADGRNSSAVVLNDMDGEENKCE